MGGDFGDAVLTPWNVYESLDDEEMIAGTVRAALEEEDAAWIVKTIEVALVARFINQAAGATGADRGRLCAAFAGTAALDSEVASKVAMCLLQPAAVG
jgi:DNA-binding phage protein